MVLAFTNEDTPIAQLAQLANKVMEVVIPTVSKFSVQPNSSILEQLQWGISSLKQEIKTLYNPHLHKCHTVIHQAHTIIPQKEVILAQCAGTIKAW